MTDTMNVMRERLEDVKAELYCSTEAFTQSLAFGRMRLVSYDQCWASKQATTLLLSLLCAHPAPSSDELLEALEAEIARLRPHYQGRGLDQARVQMLDHFADFIAKHKGS